MKLNDRGLLIVISGPSGVGKGTVRKALFEMKNHNLTYSVSMTTRKIRPGEKDGRDYYFVSREEFERKINEGKFLEHAKEWNAKINVISRKDIDELYRHHVLHSLMIGAYLKYQRPETYKTWQEGGLKVLDLGTGGGFPGIPLAILFPKVNFTLCDSF